MVGAHTKNVNFVYRHLLFTCCQLFCFVTSCSHLLPHPSNSFWRLFKSVSLLSSLFHVSHLSYSFTIVVQLLLTSFLKHFFHCSVSSYLLSNFFQTLSTPTKFVQLLFTFFTTFFLFQMKNLSHTHTHTLFFNSFQMCSALASSHVHFFHFLSSSINPPLDFWIPSQVFFNSFTYLGSQLLFTFFTTFFLFQMKNLSHTHTPTHLFSTPFRCVRLLLHLMSTSFISCQVLSTPLSTPGFHLKSFFNSFTYLGSLRCDYQDRRARARNKEGCQRMGRLDTHYRSRKMKFQELVLCL